MTEASQLLQRYAQAHDEEAFAELIKLHLDLVYSTALRRLGDIEQAKDVAQVVFTDFARKARSISPHLVVPGWLYRHTVFVAAKVRRTEMRRQNRELKMMSHHQAIPDQADHSSPEEIRPWLDEAMQRLKSGERDALVLRFFQGKSLVKVGQALGLKENAARIKGIQISETMVSEEGMPTVGILHELEDGPTENSWITYKQVGDRWQIHSLIGFPIKVFQAKSNAQK